MDNVMLNAKLRRKTREVKKTAGYMGWGVYGVLALTSVFAVGWLVSAALDKVSISAILIPSIAVILGLALAAFVVVRIPDHVTSTETAVLRKGKDISASQAEAKYKALIQHSLDIITIIDAKGNIQYQSPSSERVLGYMPDSLVGQSIFELIHTDDHALMSNALMQKTTFFFSFRMQHHDGSWLYFESSGTNMLVDPIVRGIVLNSRDITDRKREEDLKKQKEMAAMRSELEKEKAQREKEIIEAKNNELQGAYAKIEHQNKEIHDSINYAFRIQKALLPEFEYVKSTLPNSFIFWRPKDIVSGDFYWFAQVGKYTLFTAADCTGHGVPGAFMTMIGNTLLNQVVKQQGYLMPDEILNNLHVNVRRALGQDRTGSTSRDGMDISFMCIDRESKKLYWAGANNPLVIVRNNEIIEYKADKYPIGGLQVEEQRVFSRQTIDMLPGDFYYCYTDGFQDQFGGDKGRKYMTKRFKEYLAKIHVEPVDAQPQMLDKEITEWIGNEFEQIDDILILGYRYTG